MSITPKNCDVSVKKAIQQISRLTGIQGSPIFANLTLLDLTASRIVATDANKTLVSLASPLIVAEGGTGAATLTDHSILLGSGTQPITALGLAANGQIPIGFQNSDPVLANITGNASQVIVTNGAGTIALSTPQDIHTGATPTFAGLISTDIIQATDFAKTGWPITSGVTLSFVGGTTRTFTVTDGGSAYYYIDGVKYTLGENKTVVIDDIEGLWFIYFDGAALTASQTIWSFLNEDKAIVAYLYWARDVGTPANGKAIFVGWELHSFHMSGATHARLHYAGGARWETGLLVADNLDDTVDVSAGDIWDEDLNIPITDDDTPTALFEQILSPARLPIYYRDGASAWRIYETNEKANLTDVGYLTGGNLKYNDPTTTWSNETVGGNNYVAYYVVATNEQAEPIVLIMGQRADNKLSEAKANNVFSGLSLAGLPFEEMVVLARLILKDTATYTLEEVLDLRAYNIKGNITSPLITQHAGLGGLNWASAGHYFDAAVDFNAQNISNIGTVGCGVITGTSTAVFEGASVTVGEASTTTGTLILHDSGSANTIALTVPNALAGSLSFTLPPTDGDNLDVLQTNGSGVLTWVAPGGGASTWIGLTDTDPANYTGQAGNTVIVNVGEDGLKFGAAPGGTFTSKCSVYRNATQSIPSGNHTKIEFNTENYDTNGEFDNASDYRFQPSAAGYYHVVGQVWLGSIGVDKSTSITIRKNNGEIARSMVQSQTPDYLPGPVVKDVYLNGSTDYIEIFCYHNSGVNRNTVAGNHATYCCIHRFA